MGVATTLRMIDDEHEHSLDALVATIESRGSLRLRAVVSVLQAVRRTIQRTRLDRALVH